jgi:hypothetical protein
VVTKSKPSIVPYGFLLIEDAIDRAGKRLLPDEWTGDERDLFERVAQRWRVRNLPKKAKAEFRENLERREKACSTLRRLCAWGVVTSVIWRDDNTRGPRIPIANWYDDQKSTDMCRTGRGRVIDEYSAARDVTGWVLIDQASLDAALSADSTAAEGNLLPNEAEGNAADGVAAEAHAMPARPSPKRGPQPIVLNRVKADMRAARDQGTDDLGGMKEEEMAARFGASRDTCRRARRGVLSEKADNSNLDKYRPSDK